MGRFYPMLMTAAGTIPPAKVLVLGVGVAGLQALATAKRLGARTTGYDVRPEVAEQVAVARRAVARPRPRGERRGRLRARADRRGARPPAAGADRRDQGLRRGHHDRARPGPPGAEARHRGGGRRDEARLGDRRPRRRGGRQLRADRARADRRPPRREDRLAAEPARRAWPSTPRSCSRATCSRCSSCSSARTAALKLDFEDEIVAGACIVRDGEIVNPGAKAASRQRRRRRRQAARRQA